MELVCKVSEFIAVRQVLLLGVDDVVVVEIAEAGGLGYRTMQKAEQLSEDGVQ